VSSIKKHFVGDYELYTLKEKENIKKHITPFDKNYDSVLNIHTVNHKVLITFIKISSKMLMQ